MLRIEFAAFFFIRIRDKKKVLTNYNYFYSIIYVGSRKRKQVSSMYTVDFVDLDLPRGGDGECLPEIDGGGSFECETLEEAIKAWYEIREDKYMDACIIGENVPRKYSHMPRYI